jgi:FMN phosphatase YigB (HAD superfamily)
VNLTLLLDLDDTLFNNDINIFLPEYLRIFSEEVSGIVEPEKFVKELLTATGKMIQNQQPDCTLKDVFNSAFFPALGLDPDNFQEAADRFYVEVFPKLESLTSKRKAAKKFVESAIECGYSLAISTNPLFPMSAIQERLSWAGLSPDIYHYDLVASYETFHFTKPDPAFFAEVMARLGWPEGRVLVVGDDIERDIEAARKLGIHTFWITQDGATLPFEPGLLTAGGTLDDVLPWLKETTSADLLPDYTSPAAVVAILKSTPAVLDSLCRVLPFKNWTHKIQPDEWSITEIICHLRDVDVEVNIPRIRAVLDEQYPFLPGMDTDPWANERQYICQNGYEALYHFISVRKKLLALISSMQAEDWERTARHAILGRTKMAELVNIIASHDRIHIKQFHQVFKSISS